MHPASIRRTHPSTHARWRRVHCTPVARGCGSLGDWQGMNPVLVACPKLKLGVGAVGCVAGWARPLYRCLPKRCCYANKPGTKRSKHCTRHEAQIAEHSGQGSVSALALGSPSWDPLGPNRFTTSVRFWPGGGPMFNPPSPPPRIWFFWP